MENISISFRCYLRGRIVLGSISALLPDLLHPENASVKLLPRLACGKISIQPLFRIRHLFSGSDSPRSSHNKSVHVLAC